MIAMGFGMSDPDRDDAQATVLAQHQHRLVVLLVEAQAVDVDRYHCVVLLMMFVPPS
jgi:hypothetical protein